MEAEVEILEPKDDLEISVQAEVAKVKVPVQTIIVNNEQQILYSTAYALICPKCRNILQQFQPGVPEIDVYKALNTDKEDLLNHSMYCVKCGQKIKVMRPMPVVVDTPVVTE